MSSTPPPKPTGNKTPVDKHPVNKPPAKPATSSSAASNPLKPTVGKPAPKPAPGRRVPEAPGRRQEPQPSRIIMVGIVIGFVASAASAVAPLLFRVSNWWLALSLFLLVISAISAMALRE